MNLSKFNLESRKDSAPDLRQSLVAFNSVRKSTDYP